MRHAKFGFASNVFKSILLLALLLTIPLPADPQLRDFLSTVEADQIRQTQEPNARLLLYIQFAQNRVGMVEDLLRTPRTGRAFLIHRALEEYTSIIDAIDLVIDDALERGLDVSEGMKKLIDAEKALLERLQKILQSNPPDLSAYRFVLETAIETTADSYELAQQDLEERKIRVKAEEEREKKEREALMSPEELEERKEVERKLEEEKKRKPSLLKPGETLEEVNNPQEKKPKKD